MLFTVTTHSRENAFGALRVCAAMKAPVGLLSGERFALADGGALPRQVPQGATNANYKNNFSAIYGQSETEAILDILLLVTRCTVGSVSYDKK